MEGFQVVKGGLRRRGPSGWACRRRCRCGSGRSPAPVAVRVRSAGAGWAQPLAQPETWRVWPLPEVRGKVAGKAAGVAKGLRTGRRAGAGGDAQDRVGRVGDQAGDRRQGGRADKQQHPPRGRADLMAQGGEGGKRLGPHLAEGEGDEGSVRVKAGVRGRQRLWRAYRCSPAGQRLARSGRPCGPGHW